MLTPTDIFGGVSFLSPKGKRRKRMKKGNNNQATKRSVFNTHSIAVISVLSAISIVLYRFVKFPLPIFPEFLDIQISDMPALLAGFAIGPLAGSLVIIVKCLFKMMFTSTATVGEWADMILGVTFVLVSSIVYHRNKNRKGAIVGLLLGLVANVIMSVVANYTLLIPFYMNAFGVDAIVGMVSVLFPAVTADNFMSYYIPYSVVPFNIIRGGLCAFITYILYKPLSRALHW